MRILVADDKPDLSNLVRIYMEKEGWEVIVGNDGKVALEIFQSTKVDLCIFDIMMPGLDGFSLVQKIRKTSNVPIIILTAKTMNQDIVLGLDLGADDYICKPFNSLELVSRVKAQLRRSYTFSGCRKILKFGDIEINTEKCQVFINEKDCELTATEYKILIILVNSPDHIFTKNQLYNEVFGEFNFKDENTITVHISRLREKLMDSSRQPRYIQTIRGLGYKINEQ
ncbi:MAG: response regulator transcription factor [Spirochaetales bacterium]|nr:response regulator transcription factor [Spirochaetales bacterium]